jgi:hypothetical protein
VDVNFYKGEIKMRSTSAFFALSLSAGFLPVVALAGGPNEPSGTTPANATVGSLAVNAGRVLCTAAINSNGSIATTPTGSFVTTGTGRLTKGQYAVVFKGPCGNVQAVNGWFHSVHVDTLTTGALGPTICTTADLAGNPAGVFVICFCPPFNPGFSSACDTSFELSASR